jgi:beta-galactosidase/beta-glucuronidase
MNKQILAGATLLAFAMWAMAEKQLPLSGQRRFRLDRMDAGVREQWLERALPDKITLPGSLPAQGIGGAVSTATKWIGSIVDQSWFNAPEFARYRQPGDVKVPFWLTPVAYYAGAAWYQLDIEIPTDWSGKRVVLSLERSHWETRVWVDDKPFGTNNALATPHEYDLGQLTPGKHSLTIRADNRMVLDAGENSHSISDHTQGNWNGIVGKIELRATPLVWIEDLQVYPHVKSKSAEVRGRLGNATGKALTKSVGLCLLDRFDAQPRFPTTNVSVECPATGGLFEAELNCGDPVTPWDEFSPRLYVLAAQVGSLPDLDSREVRFGFAETSTRGTQFLINARPPETTNAFDGDPETIWHTPWSELAAGCAHEIVVEFDSVKTLAGFSALPRQDGNHNAWIRDYAVYASADGLDWGEPVAKGTFNSTKELKTVTFKRPAQARFVKLVALSAFDEQPFASLAELEFLSAGQDQS